MAATKEKPRAHLSDLFLVGRDVTISSDGVDYVLWMRRPSATQSEEAAGAANAKSLRLKMQYRNKDGDRYLTLSESVADLDDVAELLDLRVRFGETDLRQRAFNEVLHSADHGSDWTEDGRYLSLLTAITARWDEIHKYNEEMEKAGSDDRIVPENDEQLSELLKEQDKFTAEVDARFEELKAEVRVLHQNKPLAQLRNEIIKESIDVEARAYWYQEYQIRMLYYACRDLDDHEKMYFANPDDVLELPSFIRQELYREYEELERGADDVKNSLSLPSS